MNHYCSVLSKNMNISRFIHFVIVSTFILSFQTSYAGYIQFEGHTIQKIEKLILKAKTNPHIHPSSNPTINAIIANINAILDKVELSEANRERLFNYNTPFGKLCSFLTNDELIYIANNTFTPLFEKIEKHLKTQTKELKEDKYAKAAIIKLQNLSDEEFNVALAEGIEEIKVLGLNNPNNTGNDSNPSPSFGAHGNTFASYDAPFGEHDDPFGAHGNTFGAHGNTFGAHGFSSGNQGCYKLGLDKPPWSAWIPSNQNGDEEDNSDDECTSQILHTNPIGEHQLLSVTFTSDNIPKTPETVPPSLRNISPKKLKTHPKSPEVKDDPVYHVLLEIDRDKQRLEPLKAIASKIHGLTGQERYYHLQYLKQALTGYFLESYWLEPYICAHPDSPLKITSSFVDINFKDQMDPKFIKYCHKSKEIDHLETCENDSDEKHDYFNTFKSKEERKTALHTMISCLLPSAENLGADALLTYLSRVNTEIHSLVTDSCQTQATGNEGNEVPLAVLYPIQTRIHGALKNLFSASRDFFSQLITITRRDEENLVDDEVMKAVSGLADSTDPDNRVITYFELEKRLLLMNIAYLTPYKPGGHNDPSGPLELKEIEVILAHCNINDTPEMIFAGFHYFLRTQFVDLLFNSLMDESYGTGLTEIDINAWTKQVQLCLYLAKEIIGTCHIEKSCLMTSDQLEDENFITSRKKFYNHLTSLWKRTQDKQNNRLAMLSTSNNDLKILYEHGRRNDTHRKGDHHTGQFSGKSYVFGENCFIRECAKLKK